MPATRIEGREVDRLPLARLAPYLRGTGASRRESPQVVAHQLGHKTAAMVHAVYGRYVPIASDYRSGQTVGLTVASESASIIDKTRAAG